MEIIAQNVMNILDFLEKAEKNSNEAQQTVN